jgi:hypothetical protein
MDMRNEMRSISEEDDGKVARLRQRKNAVTETRRHEEKEARRQGGREAE